MSVKIPSEQTRGNQKKKKTSIRQQEKETLRVTKRVTIFFWVTANRGFINHYSEQL